MHHALFPQNPQTATFCSYKDDNESAARWMSEREREPLPLALLSGPAGGLQLAPCLSLGPFS